ncbi:MAG: lytic murein transglycosylase B [Myxococcota bacterium]
MLVAFAPLAARALEPAAVAEVAAAAAMTPAEVEALLAPLVKDDTVLTRMATPWEKKPWHQYRALFLTEERIGKGRAFRTANADWFAKAEAKYGVPTTMVLAILGVETFYGEKMGADAVATSLYTLGFFHPKRGAYFRTELGQFFRLAKDQGWAVTEPRGSYAGAMGMGQFMPSSYRSWAVDFDGDGKIDLFHSAADAIGSVANYFAAHGWTPGGPVLVDATVTGDPSTLLKGGLEPDRKVAALREAGVTVPDTVDAAADARLFSFDGPTAKEYRVGFHNFYVITRYNKSTMYARAAWELSQAFDAPPVAAPPK